VLRFVTVFHAALTTLTSGHDASPQLQHAAATPDVQGSIVFSELAVGSSLSRISSPGESAASAAWDSAKGEEELWDMLSALDTEQLTAVMEDAGAVLWSDGTFHKWLHVGRKFDLAHRVSMQGLGNVMQGGWRRFIPAYADIFAAVDTWMDEWEDVERDCWWERQIRKVLGVLDEWRWWASMVLVIYEIAFGLLPFVLSLELSGWARYNLWAYLVLHSAAFFKTLWMLLSDVFVKDGTLWSGNFAETDLLFVSIAVLVRTRRHALANSSPFPRLSLLNIARDARCVFAGYANIMGVSNQIAPECPHGTATTLAGLASGVDFRPGNSGSEIRLAPEPEPHSSKAQTLNSTPRR